MSTQKILFIFRKPNKGNFSIEKVYHNIVDKLKDLSDNPFIIEKKELKKNYDIITFFTFFMSSLFSNNKIVHITGGCNYMVMAFPFKTKVLTIHDLFHFKKKSNLKGTIYDLFYYYLPIRFSNYVVVVSENTKQDVLTNFSIKEDRIIIKHNPLIIPSESITYRERSYSKEQVINVMQIGDKPLKNYRRLIEATKDLNVFYNFIHANDNVIKELIYKFNIQDKSKIHTEITDDELYVQYNVNDVLYFASEAEGFGLPIIEAQAFGMQIITSNIPPMSVIGKGTILVDPFSVSSIKEGFVKLYNVDIQKENLVVANQNVKNFNLQKVVIDYMNFYKKIA